MFKALFASLLITFLVISTMSLAQIRYAVANFYDLASINVLVGLLIEAGVITGIIYLLLFDKNKNGTEIKFSLVGSKGGKSTKKKSNLNDYGKNQRSSL